MGAYTVGILPESTRKTTITIVPKPGLVLLNISTYWPILLLNSEYKILGKLIANRLGSVHSNLCQEGTLL